MFIVQGSALRALVHLKPFAATLFSIPLRHSSLAFCQFGLFFFLLFLLFPCLPVCSAFVPPLQNPPPQQRDRNHYSDDGHCLHNSSTRRFQRRPPVTEI